MSNTQSSSPTLDTVLYINDVSVYHKHEPLLKQIHLKIEKGSFHCLIGESGSGKSLLTRTVLNMKEDDLTYRGEIHLDLTQTDAMFQDANRNFFQNVRIKRHFDALFDSMSSLLTREQQKAFVLRQFKHLGLDQPESIYYQYPFELSGGMAQRVALVMAIVREAQFLIADEPTSALDQHNRHSLMALLHHVVTEHDMTVLFVTHDLNLVLNYATHISVMLNGNIVETGRASDILRDPQHAYTKQLIELANRRYQYVTD